MVTVVAWEWGLSQCRRTVSPQTYHPGMRNDIKHNDKNDKKYPFLLYQNATQFSGSWSTHGDACIIVKY